MPWNANALKLEKDMKAKYMDTEEHGLSGLGLIYTLLIPSLDLCIRQGN